jgi:hydroxymethylpyrimidine pyrophosphatase-like HAD family hydrolase
MIAFIDIDGTLSDSRKRVERLKEDRDYNTFFEKCGEDDPIEHTVEIVKGLLVVGNVEVVFLTGRPERVRSQTMIWLENALDSTGLHVIMRGNKDYSKAAMYKERILKEFKEINHEDTEFMIMDDDETVINTFKQSGVLTYHVK